ncbi:MAG: DPP IV N-terminal domain-containing protein [Pyrinomonadaceae bacterium]
MIERIAKLLISSSFIFLTTLGTGAQTAMFQQDVSWSPDGKYLAFTGLHDIDQKTNTLKADLYVIRVDGSDVRKISGDDKNEFYTSWAKRRIAFSSEIPGSKRTDIFYANPDGTGIQQITNGPGQNTAPAFSSDGKRIAFVSTREGGKYQLYTMMADGSKVTRLTKDNDAVGYFNPQWSSDGKRIVCYTEKGDGKDQVWIMNSDGSNKTLLTAGVGHNIYPGWSPDGKKIIFSSSKRDSESNGSFIDGSFLYTMNADGSGLYKTRQHQKLFRPVLSRRKKDRIRFGSVSVDGDLHRECGRLGCDEDHEIVPRRKP